MNLNKTEANKEQRPTDVASGAGLGGTQRIQLSRKAGWKMPPNTVVVSRPSKWGNPFKASELIAAFDGLKDPQGMAQTAAVEAFRRMVKDGKTPPFNLADIREELRGKNLACWCKLGTPCHADFLMWIANAA